MCGTIVVSSGGTSNDTLCRSVVLEVAVVVVAGSGVVLQGRGTVRQPGIEIVLIISKLFVM